MSMRTKIIAYFAAISLSICCSAYIGGRGRAWIYKSFSHEYDPAWERYPHLYDPLGTGHRYTITDLINPPDIGSEAPRPVIPKDPIGWPFRQ
jgi:hypothetical protein